MTKECRIPVPVGEQSSAGAERHLADPAGIVIRHPVRRPHSGHGACLNATIPFAMIHVHAFSRGAFLL
jgi:hypothetical protein